MNNTEEISALNARVEVLEQDLADKKRTSIRARRVFKSLVGVGAVVAILGATVAIAGPAVSLTCSPEDEIQLFCFNPQEPALASEVNHNFLKVKEWVENKVGDVDANIDNVTITGNLSVAGDVASTGGYLSAQNWQTHTGSIPVNGTWQNVIPLQPGVGKTYLIFGGMENSTHHSGFFLAIAGSGHVDDHFVSIIHSAPGWNGAMTEDDIRWSGNFIQMKYDDAGTYSTYDYYFTVTSTSP